jgi:hypothetical protein
MVEQLDFDEILARNPQLGREAVERAKALQRALREQRGRQPKRPGMPKPSGIPRATTPDDPSADPRVHRLPRSAKIR